MVILLIIELAIALPLLLVDFRRKQISAPLLKMFAKVTPKLSETEQTALEAGTVGFEGELFSGKPDWHERSEEHTSELQSLMRISYAVFCLKKKKKDQEK